MKKKGFTLVEILITLAIMAVVFSLLFMTFHQSMTAMGHTEDRAEGIQQGRLILERMSAEIKGSFMTAAPGGGPPVFQGGLVGQSRQEGAVYRDRLDFTAWNSGAAEFRQGKTDMHEIGYFLDHEPGGKGLTLFRREDDALDGNLLRGGSTLALCDRVRSLRFVFFDRQGREQNEWNSLEGAKRHQLPLRVEIQLTLEDAAGQGRAFRTQVYLPLAGVKE